MQLYSHNNQYPTKLPNRLKFSDGTTRTDPETFTAEEIAAAGWVAVDNPPQVLSPKIVEWGGTEWVVRDPGEPEIAKRWESIKRTCQEHLDITDYKVIKALEAGTPLSADLVAYRQALRDLYNNVNDVDPWTVQFPSLNVLDESEEQTV